MFIGLLSACIIRYVGVSWASNYKEPIKCVSLNNKACQTGSCQYNLWWNSFFPYTFSVNKCGGSCNIVDDPCARDYVPNKVENVNAKVFYLMSMIN